MNTQLIVVLKIYLCIISSAIKTRALSLYCDWSKQAVYILLVSFNNSTIFHNNSLVFPRLCLSFTVQIIHFVIFAICWIGSCSHCGCLPFFIGQDYTYCHCCSGEVRAKKTSSVDKMWKTMMTLGASHAVYWIICCSLKLLHELLKQSIAMRAIFSTTHWGEST